MKGKKCLSLALALLMIFFTVSCGKEEPETTAAEETKTLSDEERALADTEQMEAFVSDYRAGKFDGEKLFQYPDLSVYFTLAPYQNLTYPDDPYISKTVSDEEVENYMTRLILENKVSDDKYTTLTEGVTRKFDVVTIDYEGMMDGKKADNSSATDTDLLLGSGTFIDGFEEGLIGKKIGSTVTLNLTFSPYYSNTEVAGKEITFTVTVKKALRPEIGEFKVEDFNSLTQAKFEDLESVRAFIRQTLESQKETRAYSNLSVYLQNRLIRESTLISYPEKEVEHSRKLFVDYYAQGVEEGTTLEEFCETKLGMTYEEFDARAWEYARESVKATLMIKLLAQKEGIVCTEEQLKSVIVQMYESNLQDYDSMEEFLSEYRSLYGVEYFEDQVISAAVSEYLTKNAKVETQ